jgi:hypothetical protein
MDEACRQMIADDYKKKPAYYLRHQALFGQDKRDKGKKDKETGVLLIWMRGLLARMGFNK